MLSTPGEQDLTAHVNFSQLIRAGEAAGLKTVGMTSQAEFLATLVQRLWVGSIAPLPAEVRQFQALTHPEHLGRAFRVLVQSRLP